MSKLRKRFSREERLEITKQSFEPDAMVTQIADRFGISTNTLSRWRQEFRLANNVEPLGQSIKAMTDEERRIARLKSNCGKPNWNAIS